MGTLVSEKVDIGVNVLERSVTATANWVFQLALRVAKLRGLSPDSLIGKRQIIEDGLFTWLAEQTLEGISIEILDSKGEDAFERFDFEFTYRAEADLAVRNPNIAKLEEFCRTLRELPSGVEYRMVVSTASGATKVEGWYPYEFRPLHVDTEQLLSDHGFGNVGTKLIYRGGAW